MDEAVDAKSMFAVDDEICHIGEDRLAALIFAVECCRLQ